MPITRSREKLAEFVDGCAMASSGLATGMMMQSGECSQPAQSPVAILKFTFKDRRGSCLACGHARRDRRCRTPALSAWSLVPGPVRPSPRSDTSAAYRVQCPPLSGRRYPMTTTSASCLSATPRQWRLHSRHTNDGNFSIHELKSPEGWTIYLVSSRRRRNDSHKFCGKSVEKGTTCIAVTIIWNVLNCTTAGHKKHRATQ